MYRSLCSYYLWLRFSEAGMDAAVLRAVSSETIAIVFVINCCALLHVCQSDFEYHGIWILFTR